MFTLTLICMNALKLASKNVEKLVGVCVGRGRGTRFTARSSCCCWWESDSEGSNLGESECVRTPLGIQDTKL